MRCCRILPNRLLSELKQHWPPSPMLLLRRPVSHLPSTNRRDHRSKEEIDLRPGPLWAVPKPRSRSPVLCLTPSLEYGDLGGKPPVPLLKHPPAPNPKPRSDLPSIEITGGSESGTRDYPPPRQPTLAPV